MKRLSGTFKSHERVYFRDPEAAHRGAAEAAARHGAAIKMIQPRRKDMHPFHTRLSYSLIIFVALVCFAGRTHVALAQGDSQASQSSSKTKDDETNLDTQLYLIVGTNQEGGDAKLPVALDQVLKELRSSLPFRNYRLSATLINRVKSDGRFSIKWIAGPMLASAATTPSTPSFNEFSVGRVLVLDAADGRKIIRMDRFSFGARVPIQTYSAVASNAAPTPIINYENTGLNTDISIREGEAVIVGTLTVGPSGDAIILVMSAKRAMK